MKSNTRMSLIIFLFVALVIFFGALRIKHIGELRKQMEIKVDEIEDSRGLGYSGQRKIVNDSKGNIFVAYRKKFEGKSEIFVARVFRDKLEWKVLGNKQPISLVGKKTDQRVPSISVDKNDVVHVVWYGSDTKDESNNRQIKYSKSTDGGSSWSGWKNISVVDGFNGKDYWQEHPYVLSASSKDLFVVWEGKDEKNKNQQIKFSKSTDGGDSWSGWKNVKETADNTQSRPTLVQNKDGQLFLLAYSSLGNENKKQQIILSRSQDKGETWSDWESVSDPESDSRHVSAVFDSNGALNLAWRSQKNENPSVISFRTLKGDAWLYIRTVNNSARYQFFPSVGLDEAGMVNVTWMETETASDLPTENPSGGRIFKSVFNFDVFSAPMEISLGISNLYPHLPEVAKMKGIPAVYESGNGKKFDVKLRILK